MIGSIGSTFKPCFPFGSCIGDRSLQRLPAGKWSQRPGRQIAGRRAVGVGRGQGFAGDIIQPQVRHRERVVLEGPVERILRRRSGLGGRPGKAVLNLAEVQIAEQRDPTFRASASSPELTPSIKPLIRATTPFSMLSTPSIRLFAAWKARSPIAAATGPRSL